MGVDTKGRRSKKRQKLEKLKKEAKRRLKAKSKAKEKENLKEIAMGARLKKRSEIKSEEFRQIGLSEQMLGARDKSEAISEVMGQNEEAMMDGRRKKASKAKSKEKVDFKKLFRVRKLLNKGTSTTTKVSFVIYFLLQFQSFTERIANIRIDVSHRIGHSTDSPEVGTE
jgi:hypothetical protein